MKKNPIEDIVNRIIWKKCNARIDYIDRKNGNRILTLNIKDIQRAGTSFIIMKDGTMIPYHRITLIVIDGKIYYEKSSRVKKWIQKNTSYP
ncbi:MAG: RNA repair domain-containing protein [Thermoplasmata archaeon]